MTLEVNNQKEIPISENFVIDTPDHQSQVISKVFEQKPPQWEATTELRDRAQSYPSSSVKQFNEMAIPPVVPRETDHKLIEKETAESVMLTEQLSSINQEQIDELLNVIDDLDFQNAPTNSILLHPKLSQIALEALRRGVLDRVNGQKQVATICNFWAALQYHKDQSDLFTLSITDDSKHEFLKQTFYYTKEPDQKPFLEGEKFERFIEKMKQLPFSEQKFLIVPDLQGIDSIDETAKKNNGNPFKATVSQATFHAGVNVFNRCSINDQAFRIVPSFGMMQAFLEAQYGDDAVEIKPRLYLSTMRHIYQSRLESNCDVMIPSLDTKGNNRCPSKADGYFAPWYDFTAHDFYHAILTSSVGKTYRKVAVFASDTIREFEKTAPEADKKGLRQLAFSLIDMDFVHFHHFHRSETFTKATAFWFTMNLQLELHQEKYQTYQILKNNHITPPFHIGPISKESETKVLQTIVNTFIHEKKGPAELNQKSLETAIDIYEEEVEGLKNEELSQDVLAKLQNSPLLKLKTKHSVQL